MKFAYIPKPHYKSTFENAPIVNDFDHIELSEPGEQLYRRVVKESFTTGESMWDYEPVSVPATETKEIWRLIEVGEAIKQGDEFLGGATHNWLPSCAGSVVCERSNVYRRRVKVPIVELVRPAQYDDVKKERDELKEVIATMQKSITAITVERNSLRDVLGDHQRGWNVSNAECMKLRAKLVEATRANQYGDNEFQKLRERVQEQDDYIKKLCDKTQEYVDLIRELRTDRGRFMDQVAKLEGELVDKDKYIEACGALISLKGDMVCNPSKPMEMVIELGEYIRKIEAELAKAQAERVTWEKLTEGHKRYTQVFSNPINNKINIRCDDYYCTIPLPPTDPIPDGKTGEPVVEYKKGKCHYCDDGVEHPATDCTNRKEEPVAVLKVIGLTDLHKQYNKDWIAQFKKEQPAPSVHDSSGKEKRLMRVEELPPVCWIIWGGGHVHHLITSRCEEDNTVEIVSKNWWTMKEFHDKGAKWSSDLKTWNSFEVECGELYHTPKGGVK